MISGIITDVTQRHLSANQFLPAKNARISLLPATTIFKVKLAFLSYKKCLVERSFKQHFKLCCLTWVMYEHLIPSGSVFHWLVRIPKGWYVYRKWLTNDGFDPNGVVCCVCVVVYKHLNPSGSPIVYTIFGNYLGLEVWSMVLGFWAMSI